MSRKLWLLALCVVGLMLVANGQKPETKSETKSESTESFRYELTTEEDVVEGKSILLLDTQTGRVWRYYPAKRGTTRTAFVAVGFGELDSKSGQKSSASEDSGR